MQNKITDAERYKQWFGLDTIPNNMAEYIGKYYSNLQANICNTDVENGYGVRISKDIRIQRYCERCNNCDYHSLWNPDDSEIGCRARGGRHTLTKRWETVFVWNPDSGISLEDAFNKFLEIQPDENRALPVQYLSVTK